MSRKQNEYSGIPANDFDEFRERQSHSNFSEAQNGFNTSSLCQQFHERLHVVDAVVEIKLSIGRCIHSLRYSLPNIRNLKYNT